ncbi:HTH-type transcriptional activator RhaS [Mycolicibacterium aubagnense]
MQEALSGQRFIEIADRWGYRGTVSSSGGDENDIAFEGVLRDRRLTSGLQVCTAETRSLRASERTGTLDHAIMLIYSVSGDRITYRLDNGSVFTLEPGMGAVLTSADTLSIMTSSRAGEQSGVLVVQADAMTIADPDLAAEIARRTRDTTLEMTGLGKYTMERASALFCDPTNVLADKLVVESCALELLAKLIDEPINGGGRSVEKPDRMRIRRVCDYLDANLENEHHLSELAREAGMSLSSFKVKFQAVTGQTVFGYLTARRLERARIRLETGEWTVAQAAWLSGYRHPTNFSSAFRRYFGFSPRALKRN